MSGDEGVVCPSALQAGILRGYIAAEQPPVEAVHSRGGRCVPGQDRGHGWWHVNWDVAAGALEYVFVAGGGAAGGWHRHPAYCGRQPIDQPHGGIVGVVCGVVLGEVVLGGRQVEMR